MKVFRVPPDWPVPPRRNWEPPKGWQPHPSWPPAPADWEFWVDGEGRPTRGPVGLYGGAERKAVVRTALTVGLTLVAAGWIVAVMNTGDGNDAQAITSTTSETSQTPSTTPTAKPTRVAKTPAPKPAKPSATTTPRRTEAKPVIRATKPTPTKTSASTRPTPRPTKTATATTIQPTPPPPTVTIRNMEDWQKWCAPGKPYEKYCGVGAWTTPDPGN
ncbi:hypothetical protein OG394_30800 [Kribbella sp. NBC_01245]|uniref:hypothetical protein n=1 Tax=Kribbella sp. NBC_01245 TaxID=2903578 RepID=UPI002E2E3CCC|nr:hypothetical protein [Kribbella sp. NBC_01245]